MPGHNEPKVGDKPTPDTLASDVGVASMEARGMGNPMGNPEQTTVTKNLRDSEGNLRALMSADLPSMRMKGILSDELIDELNMLISMGLTEEQATEALSGDIEKELRRKQFELMKQLDPSSVVRENESMNMMGNVAGNPADFVGSRTMMAPNMPLQGRTGALGAFGGGMPMQRGIGMTPEMREEMIRNRNRKNM
ncbi:hypothetical protein [Hyphomonas sp.]|uniref:hypothetical protein n=1 Tax=Hyphomonas sp. TaxID=87 RepID=UPI000C984A02|nr:hypothetical protein [Hyphomonas sp.]MAL46594.1 hypothetical protein [Hyphomonas sp.]